MSSVRNRILQFQQNDAAASTTNNFKSEPETSIDRSTGFTKFRGKTPPIPKSEISNTNTQSFNVVQQPKVENNFERPKSASPESANWKSGKSESANLKSGISESVSLKSAIFGASRDTFGSTDELVTMSNQPKKATTMTINLSSASSVSSGPVTSRSADSFRPCPSPTRPKLLEKPKPTLFCQNSSIPKLISPTRNNNNAVVPGMTGKLPGGEFLNNLNNSNTSSTASISSISSTPGMDWKEKYEEAERKRLHIVSLAQKATRDYEELRRRYQELGAENEKVSQRLKSSNSQLEALRNASEAAYHDYYKLKKHYMAENSAKSHALSRVDEYNRENRKLKRQSAALMQHVTEGGNFDLEQLMELGKAEENGNEDKEINFLRARVQELESRVVNLESELEKTKLSEFESQEAALLINDSIQNSTAEITALRERLHENELAKVELRSKVSDLQLELESLKAKELFDFQKLQATEAELRKIQAEKNVLQRQSVVFFSTRAVDAQLQDALNQINDIQLQFEEQKLHYETQILNLQETIHDKESEYETKSIQSEAKIKSMESLVQELRQRVEEAEEKLAEQDACRVVSVAPPPPPPPPPMNLLAPPPPPPLPSGLNSSLQSVTLRKAKEFSSTGSLADSASGSSTPELKSIIPNSSATIDDVVSQIKRGIKLRATDKRTVGKKETEAGETKPAESIAIEEMRSILNNLKRTKRAS